MEFDSLPSEYDAIVLGTGMSESLLAAALSRIGFSVLHLDRNDYYSGDSGSFHFEGLQQWIHEHQKDAAVGDIGKQFDISRLLKEGEDIIAMKLRSSTISNVTQLTHIQESIPDHAKDSGVLQSTDASSKTGTKAPTTGETGALDGAELCNTAAEITGTDTTGQQLADDSVVEAVATELSGGAVISNEQAVSTEDNKEQRCSNDDDNKHDDVMMTTNSSDTQEEPESRKKEWSMEDLRREWRRFNIDLLPKVLYCNGPMVNLLISSDVAKYCEFKTVSRILTLIDSKIEQVPCSRSDVFANQKISMIEKRLLMKLLMMCLDYEKHPDEFKGFEEKSFVEFLQSRKLTETLRHYVQHSIAMVPDSADTVEGLQATQRFLRSLGRFGNTAFLWPHYGSGELSQCFCRMCAVFGGVYCLRRTAHSLILDENKKLVAVVDSAGQRSTTKWLIAESSYATSQLFTASTKRISRAVLITDRSLLIATEDYISLLHLPATDGSTNQFMMFELSYVSSACPKDLYVIHIRCTCQSGDPVVDMTPAVKQLFASDDEDDNKPRILWSLYFTLTLSSDLVSTTSAPDNCFVIPGPDDELDFDISIAEARKVFEKICPGEEFLPKAPNPEDIIYIDDEEARGSRQNGFDAAEQKTGDEDVVAETTGSVPDEGSSDRDTRTVEEKKDSECDSRPETVHIEDDVSKT